MATAPKQHRVVQEDHVSSRGGYANGKDYGAGFVPWVAVALSIATAFWSVANPRDDIRTLKAEIESRISDLRHEVQGMYLTMAEHKEFNNRVDRSLDRIDLAIRTITADQVPRSEHKQHWDEQADKVNALREQIIVVQRDFAGSWNIGKQLDAIQRQIDEIRQNGAQQNAHLTVTGPPIPVPTPRGGVPPNGGQ